MAEERKPGFDDLIEALTIMNKYVTGHAGTHCEHDELTIGGVDPDNVSPKDKERLDELGFNDAAEFGGEGFQSFRWGSC